MQPFKLLILDCDGVLTNGKKGFNAPISNKLFADRDFTAIKRFKALGISVVVLSGDDSNRPVFKARSIPFYYSRVAGVLNKQVFVAQFQTEFNIAPTEMAFVGDDVFDLDIATAVGQSFCPLDAESDLSDYSTVLEVKGGDGVVAELFRQYKARYVAQEDLDKVRALDAAEPASQPKEEFELL